MKTLSRPFPHSSLSRSDSGDAAVSGSAEMIRVPGEKVLTLVVDLPLPSRAKRLAAAPFAIEDMIADPITAVHVAVGEEVAPRRHLVVVVRHQVMRDWITQYDVAGLDRIPLVPDALLLPLPPTGEWSVTIEGERALVRADDGTGFALPTAHLAFAWIAAGRPPCQSYGDPMPDEIDAAAGVAEARATGLGPAVDLRQGIYAPRRAPLSRVWRRIAIVAAAGIAAHTAIAIADIAALHHIANDRTTATRALLERVAPGVAVGEDIATSVVDLLPAAQGDARSNFLPLLVRTTSALGPLRGTASLRTIAFDAAADTLTIEVQAPDIAGLQRVGTALAGQGLTAESGAASVDEGRATGSFTIRST